MNIDLCNSGTKPASSGAVSFSFFLPCSFSQVRQASCWCSKLPAEKRTSLLVSGSPTCVPSLSWF